GEGPRKKASRGSRGSGGGGGGAGGAAGSGLLLPNIATGIYGLCGKAPAAVVAGVFDVATHGGLLVGPGPTDPMSNHIQQPAVHHHHHHMPSHLQSTIPHAAAAASPGLLPGSQRCHTTAAAGLGAAPLPVLAALPLPHPEGARAAQSSAFGQDEEECPGGRQVGPSHSVNSRLSAGSIHTPGRRRPPLVGTGGAKEAHEESAAHSKPHPRLPGGAAAAACREAGGAAAAEANVSSNGAGGHGGKAAACASGGGGGGAAHASAAAKASAAAGPPATAQTVRSMLGVQHVAPEALSAGGGLVFPSEANRPAGGGDGSGGQQLLLHPHQPPPQPYGIPGPAVAAARISFAGAATVEDGCSRGAAPPGAGRGPHHSPRRLQAAAAFGTLRCLPMPSTASCGGVSPAGPAVATTAAAAAGGGGGGCFRLASAQYPLPDCTATDAAAAGGCLSGGGATEQGSCMEDNHTLVETEAAGGGAGDGGEGDGSECCSAEPLVSGASNTVPSVEASTHGQHQRARGRRSSPQLSVRM
ncbi:hypothetical protein Agub_g13273, partial [Astrephomene gubernaculifera]